MLTTTQSTLSAGRHTIAVQCLGTWSDDFEFHWVAPPQTGFNPHDGFVPTAEAATKIAVAVWEPIYGANHIARQAPYRARLADGVWTVEGAPLPQGFAGGRALAEIAKADGRILRVIHFQ